MYFESFYYSISKYMQKIGFYIYKRLKSMEKGSSPILITRKLKIKHFITGKKDKFIKSALSVYEICILFRTLKNKTNRDLKTKLKKTNLFSVFFIKTLKKFSRQIGIFSLKNLLNCNQKTFIS